MSGFLHNHRLRSTLHTHLQELTRQDLQSQSLISAAVVIAVTTHEENDSACILLTRRSSKLRKHAGQFALPGGKVDKNESLIQAALRELSEELGIDATEKQVVGLLDDFATQSGFCVTPIVVWIDDHQTIQANPDEVAAVFEIPLHEVEQLSIDESTEDQHTVMSIYLPSVGTTVYSPTAAIIYQFREVALCGRFTRVSHFGQPRFAWR